MAEPGPRPASRLLFEGCSLNLLVRLTDPMRQNKWSRPSSDQYGRTLYPPNPLWPLAELRDLHAPSFVPDPEFIRFDLNALNAGDYSHSSLSSKEGTGSSLQRERFFRVEFPIPRLVTGLPWRFAKDTTTPVVPDPAFVPFEIGHIARR
jgi:hypothetical protein